MKSWSMRWAGYVARKIEEMLIGKFQGRRAAGTRTQDNIKMEITDAGFIWLQSVGCGLL
jgi:hypothetical protein